MRVRRRGAVVIVAVLIGGCAAGPRFKPLSPPDVERFTSAPLPPSTAAVAVPTGDAQRFLVGVEPPGRWWRLFGSDELDRRIERALERSPSVAAALAALRQAEENLLATRGGLYPSVDAKGGLSRQQTNTAPSGAANPTDTTFNLYNASVSVSYNADIFGGARSAVEAQAAIADLQRFQLEATYLTLASNIATASFREALLRAQIGALQEVASMYGEQLRIADKQVSLGARAEGDLYPVRAQLASTRAQIPPLRAALEQVRTQLAVYLGRFPAQEDAPALDLDKLTLPTEIPVSLPSQLVQQRPDVRAAEAQVHQAAAQVGVAAANLLPQISLSASLGSQATRSGGLLSAGSGIWSVGLGLLAPIFHGGSLQAQKRAAEAGVDKATADYQNVVLNAFKNVADALQALQFDADILAAQAQFLQATERSLELLRNQYRIGAASYLQLLDSQRQYEQSRIALIQARAARLADTAALFAALGGGWWNREASMAQPSGTAQPSNMATQSSPAHQGSRVRAEAH